VFFLKKSRLKIYLKTQVNESLSRVVAGFNEALFLKLAPPFPPVKLLRFDGCLKGDIVSLELNFLVFKQPWTSLITHHEDSDSHFVFVDEGEQLPFFLKKWKHTHRMEASKAGTYIIDDIYYSTGTILTDLLMYPALYLQFLYRKPIYKRVFKGSLRTA
jgi:ligand-binding SRPBCC domain-containing protein